MTHIDLDHARRRAKELLKAARAGDAQAVAALPRRHEPVILADAQLAVARELGFASWPKLVAAAGWRRARHDDVDWTKVLRATFVPFLDGRDLVVIPEDGLPSDDVRRGEDAILDAALRIPLEQAGFRRQGTHVFALGEGGTHVAMWLWALTSRASCSRSERAKGRTSVMTASFEGRESEGSRYRCGTSNILGSDTPSMLVQSLGRPQGRDNQTVLTPAQRTERAPGIGVSGRDVAVLVERGFAKSSAVVGRKHRCPGLSVTSAAGLPGGKPSQIWDI